MILMRSFGIVLLLALMAFSANAVWATRSEAPRLIPKDELTRIRAEPVFLFSKFLDGGPLMAQYISRAVVIDPALADAILSIADKATPQQAAAMGAGLARGARAIGEKQPKTVEKLNAKVADVNNLHLRITYFAIGPDYRANLPAKMLPLIPPRPLFAGTIGSTLPPRESRLGPHKDDDLDYVLKYDSRKNEYYRPYEQILSREAPLTAIIASDARRNGAVSTSPTQ